MLKPVMAEDCVRIAEERNNVRAMLRTPGLTTQAEQEKFFLTHDRNKHKFFMFYEYNEPRGVCGLTNLEPINGRAEISLLIYEQHRSHGYGINTLHALLHEGFDNMRLNAIYGECYKCNPALAFWGRAIKELIASGKYTVNVTDIPATKYWGGTFYDSMFFTIREV